MISIFSPKIFNPSWRLRSVIFLYRCVWLLLLPFALIYLLKKSRKEPLYRAFLPDRFGFSLSTLKMKADNVIKSKRVWIHCASLGELRGVAPLVQLILDQGNYVLISTLTPAGRNGAKQLFAEAMLENRLQVVWLPLEIKYCVQRFIEIHKPDLALMSEIDTWPVLLSVINVNMIPLGFVNAQYPGKSFERDKKWGGVRGELFNAYDLILCKSGNHAERFSANGCSNIAIVGETRFDLPIPEAHINAATHFLEQQRTLFENRPVICIASCVESEEPIFITAIQKVNARRMLLGLAKPLWIVVPRSPQRFNDFSFALSQASSDGMQHSNCLHVEQRSRLFDSQLNSKLSTARELTMDVLIGDSLGEMYFYLALSQIAIVGASFVPLGSHNIIEPLALKKPVLVGSSVWGIEFPGVEATQAGVLKQCADIDILVNEISQLTSDDKYYQQITAKCEAFYQQHVGSAQRHLEHLNHWCSLKTSN